MNEELKEFMKKDLSKLNQSEKEELFNLIKEAKLLLPVEVSVNDEGVEEIIPIVVKTDTGEFVCPLFSDEDEVGSQKMLTIIFDTLDIVNILEQYKIDGVIINPFSLNPFPLTLKTLSQLFLPDFELVVAELRSLLHQNSTTLSKDTELYIRSNEPLGDEFIPEIPINVSSNKEFRKELPILNILQLSKGDKIMYVGDIVDETQRPDVVIAPETVFKLIKEEENEFTWKCESQSFYD